MKSFTKMVKYGKVSMTSKADKQGYIVSYGSGRYTLN